MTQRRASRQFFAASLALATLFALSAPLALWLSASAGYVDAGQDGMDMSMPMHHEASDTALQAAHLRDKKESEFNHHLAGFLVTAAGLFLLAENTLRNRWPWTRFAWPICFLVCGLFLLVFSDTELWPFGPMSWWYGLSHNREDVQHKTFAVILLALGAIEIQRARGVLNSAWAAAVFPVLAVVGSVLLLFHEHRSGMHGPDHMMVMRRIQAEHLQFAIAGVGIGLVKGLSEVRSRWQALFLKSWPVLLIVLGVLLMRYVE